MRKTRSRTNAPQSSLEGKRFRCYRCWAVGTFVRRDQRNWPPWYVEWVRAPLPPATQPSVLCEAQAAPMAHSYCPACRGKPSNPVPDVRAKILSWAEATIGTASA